MTQKEQGLSSAEVASLRASGKTNALKKETSRTYSGIVASNFLNVFNLAVFAIAAVLLGLYFRFQDQPNAIRTFYDSVSISTVAILNTLFSIVQEIRAKIALDKIMAMAQSMATVIRDGQEKDIPVDDIVLGDRIKLKRGDQVPVDGSILDSHHCEIDESLLTGESVSIYKEAGASVLSGSFCVAGHGVMVTERVGLDCYVHQLTKQVRSYKRFVSPLQTKIDTLVQVWLGVAILMMLLTLGQEFAKHSLKGFPLNAIDVTRSIASIITSLIPVGMILLSTVAFALGVFRISLKGALIQKLNAIESFANVDVICMDKTGTLTRNELKIAFVTPLGMINEPDMREQLAAFAHISSEQNATIVAIAESLPKPTTEVALLDEVPFNSKEKFSAVSLKLGTRPCHLVLGAFEKLQSRLPAEEQKKAKVLLSERQGYRNLLFAHFPEVSKEKNKPFSFQTALAEGQALEMIGILSLVDEIRPEIDAVLSDFQARSIQLKIVSGDAPETVQAVARASGWKEDTSRVVTGDEIDKMTPHEIATAAEHHSLFARVSPQNKKTLIEQLQQRKHYVAMVGDGVNDVLALKQAQMGIAMGAGNRMSKDVSDIVLLNNDFTILPTVFEEGLTIIRNVQSSAKLFLTKNMYSVFLILFVGFLGLAFPFVPRHVTIIGFFSISIPALLITFSRRVGAVPPDFVKDVLRFTIISGGVISLTASSSYFLAQTLWKHPPEVARIALLTQVVLLSLLNFLLIVGRDRLLPFLRENLALLGFAVGFACLYFAMLFSVTLLPALAWFKKFLELEFFPLTHLFSLFLLTLFAAALLIFLQLRAVKNDRPSDPNEAA